MFWNAWRESVIARLDQIITLLKQEGADLKMTIQEAKAAIDAEIAKAAAQNSADYQTLDDAVAANASSVQKVADDITTLLQKVDQGQQVDVSAELAGIQQNADNASKAAATIKTAVDAATAQATAADQAANSGGPSDESPPK